MKVITCKKTIFFLLIFFSLFILTTGCAQVTNFFNPFIGTWKSGIFTLEFKDKTNFVLKSGVGFEIVSEGTYDYDKNILFLNFSKNTKVEFSYEFNSNKSQLSIIPKSKSDLFKTSINFNKQENL